MKLNPADRVFVSSPFGDIRPYRKQAYITLRSLGLDPILLEKIWGPLRRDSINEKVASDVREEVTKCTAVIVILGERKNLRVPGTEWTMVEHEIQAAQKADIPILTYVTPYSRFFPLIKKEYLIAEDPDIKLIELCEVVAPITNPYAFSLILRSDITDRLIRDVPSRQTSIIPHIPTQFWATLAANPEQIATCPARYIEELVGDLLRADGDWNDVQVVTDTHKPGPDIIACSSRTIDSEPAILVVECKRYRDRPVCVEEVSKLVHWVDEEYKTTLGMIVTTSSFRQNVQSYVQEKNMLKLSLVDQEKLIQWLRKHHQLEER